MPTFRDLEWGDMFNTKSGRFVKVGITKALVITHYLYKIGSITDFYPSAEVVVLYSSNPKLRK